MRDYYCCPYKENFMCHTWINLVIKENIEFFFLVSLLNFT